MSLTVKYLDTPEGAQQAAQVSGDAGQSFSSLPGIVSGTQDIPFATLEQGVWTLDGTRHILPDSPKDVGWWSAIRSGKDGRFETPPKISIIFPAPYTATGMTFIFSPSTEQWCNEMVVRWYNGQDILSEIYAFPDSAEWIMEHLVDAFDRIEIQFIATNHQCQYAKVQMIQIGKVIVFGKSELTQVQLTNEVDPALCYLPVDTMRIEIRDRMNRAFAPQENQRMELYKSGKLLASHYIVDSTRAAKYHYTFSCQSAIGLLGDEYLGGLFNAVPVNDFLSDVLDGRSYVLDPVFAGETVTGYLPVCTRREALQQLAFALGAVVTTQRSESICLIPLPENISSAFTQKTVFAGSSAEMTPRISRVEVAAHSYEKSNEVVSLLYNKDVHGENQLFTFYEPHYDYVIEGGVIVDSDVNWVKITAEGNVTLTAKTFIHSKSIREKRNRFSTAVERNNVVTVDSATLVHSGNVDMVLERLYAAKQFRHTVRQDAVIDAQRAGDCVSSITPWNTQIQGFIASMDSILTQNGHTAMIEILGEEISG